MNSLKSLIYPSYWLTDRSAVPDHWFYTLAILFGLMMIAGILAWLFSRREGVLTPVRTLCRKIAALGFSWGLVGYILLFLSAQQIPFLSARLVYLIWVVVALIWLYRVLMYAFTQLPQRVKDQTARLEREKYLPKAK